jgi:predicted homoserine dehydrogenase-like protein
VDYVVKARPSPGVFVLATHDDPRQRQYLALYKLGDGPLYSLYTPYHLCHLEAPTSVARAVLFNDAVTAARFGPKVDVVTTAKTDLEAGQVLDGIGGYTTYGQCENADATFGARLLPMGLAEGCRLRRDLPRGEVLTFADVEVPEGRLCDRMRTEQDRHFFG